MGKKNRLPFLQLVYQIVMDCQHDNDSGIRWSTDGTAVEIHKEKFRENTLTKYFKTKLLTSFSRNMNIHGFSKTSCEEIVTYWHPDFQMHKPPQVKFMKKEPYRGLKKKYKLSRDWNKDQEAVTVEETTKSIPISDTPVVKEKEKKTPKSPNKKRGRQNKNTVDQVEKKARKEGKARDKMSSLQNKKLHQAKESEIKRGQKVNPTYCSVDSNSKRHQPNWYGFENSGSKQFISTFDKVVYPPSFMPSEQESHVGKSNQTTVLVGSGSRRPLKKMEMDLSVIPANFENTVEVSRDNSKTLLEQVLSSEVLQWDNPAHFPPNDDFLPSTPETMPMGHRISSPISIFEAATVVSNSYRY